jgi:hypothetical protein
MINKMNRGMHKHQEEFKENINKQLSELKLKLKSEINSRRMQRNI